MFTKSFLKNSFIWLILLLSVHNTYAQSDTLKTHSLNIVSINSSSNTSNLSTSPQKIITKNKFDKISAFQVSDALKFLSGVQVKDYGGIGGLKTVSVRNMGANYTTIAYDGIPITNYMTGQVDIGRFSLDNIETLQLNIGESDDIFLPARLQALGGSLNIITQSPVVLTNKKNELNVSLKAGSFEMFNPSVICKVSFNNIFALSASAEYLTSNGQYSYKQTYGYANDSTVRKRRQNSDVENWRLETNLSGNFKNGGKLLAKVYYFDSHRGIPGFSSYHDNGNSGERVKDKNFFSQLSYRKSLNNRWSFQTHAKFDISHTNYNNLKWQRKNKYNQKEYYLNASFLYQVSENLSFSLSNDGAYGIFSSDTISNQYRTSWFSSFSGKYQTSRITITGSLLNHFVHNSYTENISSAKNSNHLSPYLGVSIRPFKERSLRIRAFYKNSYRLPTFGDIYYSDVLNANLKAENAHQYNIGVTVSRSQGILSPFFAFSVDTYYNNIKNKIVILPRNSQFKPSVKNHGEVDIKGVDLNMEFHINVSADITAEVSGSYTYQHVEDKKENETLILAYTPKHSGSGYFSLKTTWADFNYNIIRSGKRYFDQIEEPESLLKAYSDHSISIIKWITWNKCNIQLSAECLNIYNKQYEIIRSYPMPGRSFRFGIKINY